MPWLIYRYLMGELLRVFALTAAVLVLVTAFGAAIKPLAADDLFGPLQTAKYVMLAIVPMLQFALPFSAGFAATIVLHRMTTDNEVLAAAASGLSYRRLLLPIAAFGAALFIVMVLLTQWIIPRFWGSMAQIIERDVVRIMQSSISKGLPVRFEDIQIHADRLLVEDNPPDTDAESRLRLFRVAAAQLDRHGRTVVEITARQAVVDVHRHEGRTYLMLALADAVAYEAETGQLGRLPSVEPDEPIAIPSPFRDDPMFLTREQLLWLEKNPDEFGLVEEAKQRVASSLRQIEVRWRIAEQIEANGVAELIGAGAGGQRLMHVFAGGFSASTFRADEARPIEIHDYVDGRKLREITAATASVQPAVGATLAHPTVDLVLGNCEVLDVRTGGVNQRAQLRVPGLAVAGISDEDPSRLPYQELLARAARHDLKRDRDWLQMRVDDLLREIRSRLQRRYALSLTALLLLLLGATLAMSMRYSVPLMIYAWAFLPSVIDILLISSGDHMIRSGLMIRGSLVMWSGNALMLVVLGFIYARLMRN